MNTRKYLYIVAFVFLFANVSFAAKWKAKHVVLIGLDGWGAYSVEKAEMPTVKKLMAEGSYTLKKRSVLPSSSAVNWASMGLVLSYTDIRSGVHGLLNCRRVY